MSIQESLKNQRLRVSMNVMFLTVRGGESQLVQLENGHYRELPIEEITFVRDGENYESPWTRWYDMNNARDASHINALREFLERHPELHDHVEFRVRIVNEFESSEPWPGYNDQDGEQIIAYYQAMPETVRPKLENMMQYELDRVDEDGNCATDDVKLVAIETLANTSESNAKKAAGAGVKL